MSADDVRRLLERAAEAPVGPLSLAVAASGDDSAWRITASWYGATAAEVTATYDREGDVLRLETTIATDATRELWQPVILAKPWVIDAAPVPGGGLAVRLWLRGEGLALNELLAAVAGLARLGPALGALGAPAAAAAPATTTAPPAPEAPTAEPAPAAVVEAASLPLSEPAPPPTPMSTSPAPPEPAASPPLPRPASGPKPEPWEILSTTPPAAASEASAAPGPPLDPGEPAAAPEPVEAAAPEAEPEPVPATAPGHCRECGAPYQADHVFCTNCGARLN
jgi:hypothetical protein